MSNGIGKEWKMKICYKNRENMWKNREQIIKKVSFSDFVFVFGVDRRANVKPTEAETQSFFCIWILWICKFKVKFVLLSMLSNYFELAFAPRLCPVNRQHESSCLGFAFKSISQFQYVFIIVEIVIDCHHSPGWKYLGLVTKRFRVDISDVRWIWWIRTHDTNTNLFRPSTSARVGLIPGPQRCKASLAQGSISKRFASRCASYLDI